MYLYAKPQIASYNRSHGKHERHAFDVAASLLFFAFTNDVRIEADPRIVDEYAAADLSDVYPLNLPSENITDAASRLGGMPTSLVKWFNPGR